MVGFVNSPHCTRGYIKLWFYIGALHGTSVSGPGQVKASKLVQERRLMLLLV